MATTAILYFARNVGPNNLTADWDINNYAILQKSSRKLLDVGYVTIIDNSNKFKIVVNAILNFIYCS